MNREHSGACAMKQPPTVRRRFSSRHTPEEFFYAKDIIIFYQAVGLGHVMKIRLFNPHCIRCASSISVHRSSCLCVPREVGDEALQQTDWQQISRNTSVYFQTESGSECNHVTLKSSKTSDEDMAEHNMKPTDSWCEEHWLKRTENQNPRLCWITVVFPHS